MKMKLVRCPCCNVQVERKEEDYPMFHFPSAAVMAARWCAACAQETVDGLRLRCRGMNYKCGSLRCELPDGHEDSHKKTSAEGEPYVTLWVRP